MSVVHPEAFLPNLLAALAFMSVAILYGFMAVTRQRPWSAWIAVPVFLIWSFYFSLLSISTGQPVRRGDIADSIRALEVLGSICTTAWVVLYMFVGVRIKR